jgi:hypothetical protein
MSIALNIRINISSEAPTHGEVSTIAPKYYGFTFVSPNSVYGIGLGGYLTIGCDEASVSSTTTFPVEIQGNFGDKDSPDWQRVGSFNATIVNA